MAIDEVSKEPWVDKDHRGCVGASYGGYSVYYLAGVHEGRFKAFISHCGIYDFDSMFGSTEELFFVNHEYGGPYWDKTNATAQRSYANSPHKLAQNWDTPIMIITGLKDYRIPYTQSLPPAGHSGPPGRLRRGGTPGLPAPELDGMEPRILRLARQIPEIGGQPSTDCSGRRNAPQRGRSSFLFPDRRKGLPTARKRAALGGFGKNSYLCSAAAPHRTFSASATEQHLWQTTAY